MAKNDAEEKQTEEEEAPQKGGLVSTLINAVGMFVLVVAGTIVGLIVAHTFLGDMLGQPVADADMAAEDVMAPESGPPIYWPLNPPMIVNLENADAGFLQITMEVMGRDQETIEAVKTHSAAIRNALLMLFATQTSESIATRDGKENLRQLVLQEIQEVLSPYLETPNVEDVYFTSFVAQ